MRSDILVKPIDILMVEDNPGDVQLTKEALEGCKMCNNLHVVEDGEQAMDFLKRIGEYRNAPKPDLIILDLNLPKKDGREVLKDIKSDEVLKTIPVVVLTTSKSEVDVLKSYKLHANCYITKPIDLEQFIEVVQSIEHFWMGIVALPT
ncbi:MAG: response regulator [Marinilabiliaceae bacterium]|nr:response regulator [Marinilabiliaceae bacterium]